MSMDYNYNPQPNRGRSHIVTLLLAMFFGALGIHRFYTGYIIIGIIQLLTGGGLGIWSLIDLFSIAAGSYKDSNGDELEDYNAGCGLIVLILLGASILICGLSVVASFFGNGHPVIAP